MQPTIVETHIRLDRKRYAKRAMRWDECAQRIERIADAQSSDRPIYMAEIGVWTGGTCSRLLEAYPRLHMTLVDPWRTAVSGSSFANSGSTNARKPQSHFDKVRRQCLERIAPFAARVSVLQDTGVAAAERVPDAHYDVVFIDGDHSYEGVSADIDAWLPKVANGGWIGGHDFGPKKHRFPGIERAVRERFETFELSGDSTWWVQCVG